MMRLHTAFLIVLLASSLLGCGNGCRHSGGAPGGAGSGSDLADFFFSVREKDVQSVDNYLRAHPGDVNAVLGDDTPLSYAIKDVSAENQEESLALIQTLLNHGADMYQEFPTSGYPIQELGARRCIDGIQLFLDHGYDINFTDSSGKCVALGGMSGSEVTAFLLENGADPNLVDGSRSVTFLYGAVIVASKRSRSHQALLASIPEDQLGNSRHAMEDSFRCVELLLEAGADTSVRSVNGEIPYELALREADFLPADLVEKLNPEE